MLSKKDQVKLRGDLFRQLDGIGTAPTAFSLHKKGVLTYLLDKKEASLQELTGHFGANEGYLNVALRLLCSQGWLIQHLSNTDNTVRFELSTLSETAFAHIPLYEDVVALLKFSDQFHPKKFGTKAFHLLETIMDNYKRNYDITFSSDPKKKAVQKQILKHIEGIMIGPAIVHLGMSGMFHKYFMEASFRPEEFHKEPESFKKLLDIFTYLKWFNEKNGTYEFTDTGLFYAKRASAYGVTVSYIPNFCKLDELIFGNPVILKTTGKGEKEKHVDRAMNVWGSGGAHSGYFKVVDEIIIELFNKPIKKQPKGILDMGCGNGAFIQHLFDVIEKQTSRGKVLDEHPLFLVGADYNETALRITKANLIQADIWAKVIWGDIGKPGLLADTLKENYGIDLVDLLNVRTFLDHNRIWEPPGNIDENRVSTSTGAYAFEGKRISNNLVEESLLEHFKKWEPFVRKHGLLVIELHTLPPELVAHNLGKTPATAYDATHGYSDQYIIEIDIFNRVMAEAGLYSDKDNFKKFPDSDLATVTINLFKGNKSS